jgi:hypothetical protein
MIFKLLQGIDDVDNGLPSICFVVDSVATMPTRGEMEDWDKNKRMAQRAAMHSEWWGRLRTLISKKNATMLAINQIRANPSPYAAPETRPGGNAWEFSTDNLIKIRKSKPVEVDGIAYQPMKFKTEKNKSFMSHQECEVHLALGHGIDPASDVIQFLKLTGCLVKEKKTYTLVGLGKDFDGMTFNGAPALERAIREERQEVTAKPSLHEQSVYHACEKLLASGTAVKLYLDQKRKPKEAKPEDADSATTQVSSVVDDEGATEGESSEEEIDEKPKLGKKKSKG